jgi:hypothetical protein
MATSPYFNNYKAKYNEQRLIDDLMAESIKIQGFDAYYIPNDNAVARDLLYGEDPVKKFNSAFPVEMYLSSIMGHEGQKDFFSKFGLEIRNQVHVLVSRKAFYQRTPQTTYMRPIEGDLVYVPFLNGGGELYEIKYVDQNKDGFTLGRKNPYYYELEMEKFKYSQEVISTGMADIDIAASDSAYTLHLNVGAGTGTYTLKELVFQSPDNTYVNATAVATVQSWIPSSNTLSVINIAGEFVDGLTIIGNTSNTRYTLATFNPLENPGHLEPYSNSLLQTNSNTYVNITETNPIGRL